MKKVPNWLIIIVVLALLVTSKFLFFAKEETAGGPGGGGAQGKNKAPVAVNYMVVQESTLADNVYTSGKIGALNEVELRPEISGKITAIYFREGEPVTAGSALVKINDADLQAQLQKNKLQLALAEQQLARLQKLLAINGVSQEETDIQQNQVNTLKADQAFIQAQLVKTLITAPFSGTVGLKNISVGAYVSPAQIIATLVQTKPLFVEFSLPEKYSSSIRKGDSISFTAQAGKNEQSFKATLYAIEPKIDDATRTFRARAMYSGSELFYPGSFVKVYVNTGSNEKSLLIPTQCVIPILKGQKVFIAKNGVAEEVKIITGIRSDEMIQVTEGLHAGDTLLTTGLMQLRKETKVKLIKPKN